jgi:esterase/lipase superfamily enzyme
MSLPRRARLGAIAVLLVQLCGCAERAHNVLIPLEGGASGTSKVDMLVMSTRQRSATAGQVFDGERAASYSLTNIVVSIPPDANRIVGEVQWPKELPANPERDFATLMIADTGGNQVEGWFRHAGENGHKVLIFVHGFNTTYEEAVYRFAQIVHDAGTRAAPVLFTWPSRGNVLQYAYDKESATYSRDALETLLTRAANDPNVTDVTVLAHSMGNWIAMEALRQMAIRHGRVYPKIKNVILAAADLDVDVFRTEFLDIPTPRPKFTLLISDDDKALRVSRRIAGDVDRLGAIDPSVEPYRSKLAEADIVAIDLTKVRTDDDVNHSKFAESPEIVRLIGTRLIEGQRIDDSSPSFGTQVSQTIAGSVAGVGSAVGQTIDAVGK